MTIDEIIFLVNGKVLYVALESVTYGSDVITLFDHLLILISLKHLVSAELIDVHLMHVLLEYLIEHLKVSTYAKF